MAAGATATHEEPRAPAELGAGSGKAGILLERLKVGKENKNHQRITSNKEGFPYVSCLHQAFGAPHHRALAAARDPACPSPEAQLKSQQQVPGPAVPAAPGTGGIPRCASQSGDTGGGNTQRGHGPRL